jgi:drug/metabolite transporter (DMT)-like permease
LLWLGGNGLVTWAEQRAHSGHAALLIAAVPIWVALIEAVLDRKVPSGLLIGSLLIGFAGIVLLSVPVLVSGVTADLWSLIAMLLAGLSWGSGTVLQTRKPVALAARVSSGYQQVFAGLGFILVALLIREPRPDPIPEAWLAWGYLVIFGSVFAFTSQCGHDVCVCQPCDRRVPGMADSARADHCLDTGRGCVGAARRGRDLQSPLLRDFDRLEMRLYLQ